VSTWAVLVAAGRGERLGGDRPKAFTGLGERVLLAESLERLEASEWIDSIVVVVPEEWEEPAILLAEELFLSRQRPDPTLVRRADLGSDWADAGSVAELRSRLPRRAAWALAHVTEPAELWRAELAWWRTVAAEAEALVRSSREGRDVIVGAVVLLGLDALRVTTALAVAAGPPSSASEEVLDALC